MNLNIPTNITKISSNFLEQHEVDVFIKREDLIHPIISGNKWRKLKYNFLDAQTKGYDKILSFGGMYSNHLHALSFAAKRNGLQSIGVVRGDKPSQNNPTLSFCAQNKMNLYYIDRQNYRFNKYSKKLLDDLQKKYGKFYMIPEGGNNKLGVKGCEEILKEVDINFDYLCCAVGTGCTASGLIRGMNLQQKFIGFCPFNNHHEQSQSIRNFCGSINNNWQLISDQYFGGFGKVNDDLLKFVKQFYVDHSIKLDLIYTGKLFFSIFDLISKKIFQRKTKLLVLHTGGIQGVSGFNFKY